MSDDRDSMEWLADELQTTIEYLDRFPQQRPEAKTAVPEYAAGLRDMAVWLLEKVQHEADWQSLRAMVAGFVPENALPRHGSELTIRDKDEDVR